MREALKAAAEVIVYIPKQGAKATATATAFTATAKYGGSRGSDLEIAVVANPENGFDATVYLNTEAIETFEGLATVGDLMAAGSAWVDFDGDATDALEAAAGLKLAGGADGVATNEDFATFLDASELVEWDVMALPIKGEGSENLALLNSAVTTIKYLRKTANKYRALVLSGIAADYPGVINVTDGIVLNDDTVLTPEQVTAWVAGADAAAGATRSNTYRAYPGAKRIATGRNTTQREEAVKKGEYVFTYNNDGEVVAQYDINTLTTFEPPMSDNTWRKNRIRRTMDAFANAIVSNFPPNKYDNTPKGWDAMEGVGASLLAAYEGAGAIRDVDYGADFKVDRSKSADDVTYFNVWIRPVDSAEKLYFTITTQ